MPSMVNKDYYALLGVSQDADTETIRKAFQQKARTLHPDVNKEPDAEERFKEVSEAYAVLSDAEKRARYDAMRSNPFAAAGSSRPRPQGTPYTGGSTSSGWPFDGAWTGTWSSGNTVRGYPYNPRPASDVHYEVPLSSKDARTGVKLPLSFTRYKRCSACSGTGSNTHEPQTCPTCKGAGAIDIDLMVLLGFGAMKVMCPECEGSGKIISDVCSTCSGAGRVPISEELELEVPAHSHDGDTLRVSGMGNDANLTSERGDFVAYVSIAAERVSRTQEIGLRVLGFCLPLLLLGIATATVGSMIFLLSGPLLFAIFMLVVSGSIKGHELGWWRNAAIIMWQGAKSGLILTVVIMLMRAISLGFSHAFLPTGS